jgi:hypothetical protein
MQYIFRCILDVDEDVIRDIAIDASCNLQEFHEAITNAFGLALGEMAAFYKSNDSWDQGEEIPLFAMNSAEVSNEMKDFLLSDVFIEKAAKALYVYDFLKMWTFFIELHGLEKEVKLETPKIVFNKGELPKQSPDKSFVSTPMIDDFEDEFGSEFGSEFDDEFGGDLGSDLDEDFPNY